MLIETTTFIPSSIINGCFALLILFDFPEEWQFVKDNLVVLLLIIILVGFTLKTGYLMIITIAQMLYNTKATKNSLKGESFVSDINSELDIPTEIFMPFISNWLGMIVVFAILPIMMTFKYWIEMNYYFDIPKYRQEVVY